jgi:hypothetical protein
MTHAETILRTLDRHLSTAQALVIYGRAALALGFDPPPPSAALSLDVGVILSTAESTALDNKPEFWSALQAANEELESQGLYLTHLFEETQVILRPDWQAHLVPIPAPDLKWLQLFRPHALDLLLTKMMRGRDPQDMEDAAFIIHSAGISRAEVADAIARARLPEIPEIETAFRAAIPAVLEITETI